MANNAERFLNGARETISGERIPVYVGKRKYMVRQVSQAVKKRIILLEQEAQILETKGKQSVLPKQARKITSKLMSLHSKKAAYYLLGNWAIFVPVAWAILWRILQLRGDETTAKIIDAGLASPDLGFFKANWDTSRLERELYMRPVGEVAKDAQERLENVINMLEKDALGVEEENK